LALHNVFGGQTASSLRPYGRNAQIICIGYRPIRTFSWVFEIPKQLYGLHYPKTKKVNQGLKSQTPPYLPNGDSVGEFFYIVGFRTLEDGGVGHLQISKKKPQSRQNAHQTQKPQISYILQT
jgi:hypothetical protein